MSIIAVVGWLALAGWAEGHGGGKGAYYQQQAATAQSASPSQEPPPLKNTTDPISVQTPCDNPIGKDAADLCQQWRMAEAAEQMIKVSWGQLILTGLSLLGLGITILYARHSNTIAREAAINQSRAYVSVEAIELYILSKTWLIARVKNTGQTPCLEYWIESALYSIAEEEKVQFDRTREMSKGIIVHGISSGRETTTPVNPDTIIAVFSDAQEKSKDLVVQGRLYYRTFFEELFFSEFVFYATPLFKTGIHEGKEVPIKFTSSGNLNLKCHQKAEQE